jgi:hypothetical protein
MKKILLLMSVFTFAIVSCKNDKKESWTTPKEVMFEKCENIDSFDGVKLGKSNLSDVLKLYDKSDSILVDSIIWWYDKCPILGELDEVEDLFSPMYVEDYNCDIALTFSDLQSVPFNRVIIFKKDYRDKYRCDYNQFDIIDLYKNSVVSFIRLTNIPYKNGKTSKRLIDKYGKGDGSIVEFCDGDKESYSQYQYYNNDTRMEIYIKRIAKRKYPNFPHEQNSDFEFIHIFQPKQYNELMTSIKTVANQYRSVQAKLLREKLNSTKSDSYTEEDFVNRGPYHSKYDGRTQVHFQGSKEQEEQLRQMDEMGW